MKKVAVICGGLFILGGLFYFLASFVEVPDPDADINPYNTSDK
jgi:hypothetical protein